MDDFIVVDGNGNDASASQMTIVDARDPKLDESAIAQFENASLEPEVRVKLSRTQFGLVFLGLTLAIFLASLDQTIVSTALKSIVEEFGHQDEIAWIGSSYLLTACCVSVLYGKFADIFGRRTML
ncbi:hypothetical protein BC830DRAFT_920574, partial [Chytriomyces sp. MP71]